jgi:hypothetical protein
MARPNKKEEDLKYKRVTLRFTESEYDSLKNLVGEGSLSDYIRKTLFSTKPIVLNSRDLLSELREIASERKKIGINLNQLAKYANQLQIINAVNKGVMDDLNKYLGELIQVERKVGEAVNKVFDR